MQVDPIDDHRALLEMVRIEGQRQPETTAERVDRWLDSHTDDWVDAVLGAELGSHQAHHEAFRLLSVERRALLVGRIADACLDRGLRGLTAGAFMLGRFVSTAQPVRFWSRLDDSQAALTLAEWAHYLAYLALLDEVGDKKLRLARQRIEEQGLAPVAVRRSEVRVFTSLKLSERSLEAMDALLDDGSEARRAVALLREPYGKLFDYSAPWSVGQLQQLCDEAGLPLPSPDDC